ncbi:unnamed protein product [Heligmosomoides polygyrus]|uniref:Uncharacterized protein n=1 Tax=Heligmosomoides polygyrus TaxID=6339 RepID=A0A183G940_HELPZ|nr:unnamed protein product [Heligmosomoides polygyrus]
MVAKKENGIIREVFPDDEVMSREEQRRRGRWNKVLWGILMPQGQPTFVPPPRCAESGPSNSYLACYPRELRSPQTSVY